MYASDVMTRGVVTVRTGTPVRTAIRVMAEKGLSGLPVVDADGRLAGIVTEGDFLRRVELGTEKKRSAFLELLRGPALHAGDYIRTHARIVDEIMVADVATVTPDSTLLEIVDIMERRRVRRVPVTEAGVLVGVVSRGDLLRALSRLMDAEPAVRTTDAEIRRRLIATLDEYDWFPRASLRVEVQDGVVTLEGLVNSERERQALRVAAENVPGVESVVDQLEMIEATAGLVGVA